MLNMGLRSAPKKGQSADYEQTDTQTASAK